MIYRVTGSADAQKPHKLLALLALLADLRARIESVAAA